MKPIRTLLAAAAITALPSIALAGGGVGVGVNLSFGFPGGVAVYSAPGYYPPPAVFYAPPPPPVYRPYYPAPVRYGSGYYGPPGRAKGWYKHDGYWRH